MQSGSATLKKRLGFEMEQAQDLAVMNNVN